MTKLWEMEASVAEAIGQLRYALDVATEDEEAAEHWPALGETAAAIGRVLRAAEGLLPLHPEVSAAIAADRDEAADWDEADRLP